MPVLPSPMPASDHVSVIERLTLDRFETLQQITTANNFPYTLNVARTARGNKKPDNLSAFITAGDAYRIDLDESGRENQDPMQQQIQPYLVEAFIRVGEDDVTPLDQQLVNLSAWIQLAWLADCSCGGHGEGTWFARHQLNPFNDPPGVLITFHVLQWIPNDNPLTNPAP